MSHARSEPNGHWLCSGCVNSKKSGTHGGYYVALVHPVGSRDECSAQTDTPPNGLNLRKIKLKALGIDN